MTGTNQVFTAESLHVSSEIGIAAALEAKRLAEKYDKDFLDCKDIIQITGLGMNNVRQLMCSEDFPYIQVGNRKVVPTLGFVLWSIKNNQNA